MGNGWIAAYCDVLFECKSKQSDVIVEFLHADLDQEKEKVFVEMPLGFLPGRESFKVGKDFVWSASEFSCHLAVLDESNDKFWHDRVKV